MVSFSSLPYLSCYCNLNISESYIYCLIDKTFLLQVILLQIAKKTSQVSCNIWSEAEVDVVPDEEVVCAIKSPNTIMVVEHAGDSLPTSSQTRYLTHLANQIRQADGTNSFTTMTKQAYKAMTATTCPFSTPCIQFTSSLTRDIVLPVRSQKSAPLIMYSK